MDRSVALMSVILSPRERRADSLIICNFSVKAACRERLLKVTPSLRPSTILLPKSAELVFFRLMDAHIE